MEFLYFHQFEVFLDYLSMHHSMGHQILPIHIVNHLIFTDYHHGALNLPIYHSYVGNLFLLTAKYTNYGILPWIFHIYLINSPIKLILSIFWDIYVFYLSDYSFKKDNLYLNLFCAYFSKSGISITFSISMFLALFD